MENIKNIVKSGVKAKQDKENQKYELIIDNVSKENNIANMYYMIGEAYGNTSEQGLIALSYLKEVLVGKFFKSSEAKATIDGIEFFDDEYKVIFPTTRIRSVQIIDLQINKVEPYNSLVRNWELKLAELIETYYFSNKSFSNLKRLRKHYTGMGDTKNLIKLIVEYKETITECGLDRALDIRRKEELDKDRLIDYEARVLSHNDRREQSAKFASSLTDLKQFTDVGWSVILKDKNRYGAITKVMYK